MARSSFIYTVQDRQGGIVAAFTVKHELASWLEHQDDALLQLTRVRDGGHRMNDQPVQLNPETLDPAI